MVIGHSVVVFDCFLCLEQGWCARIWKLVVTRIPLFSALPPPLFFLFRFCFVFCYIDVLFLLCSCRVFCSVASAALVRALFLLSCCVGVRNWAYSFGCVTVCVTRLRFVCGHVPVKLHLRPCVCGCCCFFFLYLLDFVYFSLFLLDVRVCRAVLFINVQMSIACGVVLS